MDLPKFRLDNAKHFLANVQFSQKTNEWIIFLVPLFKKKKEFSNHVRAPKVKQCLMTIVVGNSHTSAGDAWVNAKNRAADDLDDMF